MTLLTETVQNINSLFFGSRYVLRLLVLNYNSKYNNCYCWKFTAAPSHLRPIQLHTLLLYPNLSKASHFIPSQKVLIPFKKNFMTSFHPYLRRPTFHLAPDGWPKRRPSAICHPSSAEHPLAISAFLLL